MDSINSYSGLAEEESLALGKILGRSAANPSYNEHLQSTETDTNPKGPKPYVSNMGLFDKSTPHLFQNCTFNMNTKLLCFDYWQRCISLWTLGEWVKICEKLNIVGKQL